MSKVQWRPQLNALTTPRSYKAQTVFKESYGYDGLAKRIAKKNPLWSADMVKSVLLAEREEIKEILIEGSQVSLEDAFTWHLSISARLDTPDAPLPSDKDIVNVQVYASRVFIEEVRRAVQLERLPPAQKLPVIAGAEDTLLQLADVLNPEGLLKLTGTDLLFDKNAEGCGCVIAGTRNGTAIQTRFGLISHTSILIMPDIPGQSAPWNNEYTISVSTQYTENGTIRTGTYDRRLRTPLTVTLGTGAGILSGSNTTPLVEVTNGTLPAGNIWVQIQVLQDAQDGDLRFNLLDISENGSAGAKVVVAEDGVYTLPGFADSPLTNLEVTVNDYAALLKMVKNPYAGRLVDVLNVLAGS